MLHFCEYNSPTKSIIYINIPVYANLLKLRLIRCWFLPAMLAVQKLSKKYHPMILIC